MNLILITVDCLRADHLSCLGYSKRTTPNLDNLASGGVLFSEAISVSHWTTPSFLSIFTSTYPLMYGGQLYITRLRTNVAEVLKEHGYHTAAFHSNPWLSSHWGYHRGFDTFDYTIQKSRRRSLLSRPKELGKRIIGTNGKLYEFLYQVYAALVIGCPYIKGEDLNKKAIRWLHDNPNNFFLWLHYMDVHEPYVSPQQALLPFRRWHVCKLDRKAKNHPHSLSPEELNELIELYDAKISYVDEMISSFLGMLKQNNILENTFVIITADHGQQFMEHGYYGHRFCLYDELIRVPLIIVGPGLKAQVVSQQISLLDLAPTILDMIEIEKPKAFLGNSLLPLTGQNKLRTGNLEAISEADTTGNRLLNFETRRLDTNQRMVSLRTAKWKYIYIEGGQDELYCLEDDSKETKNIINVEPDMAKELRGRIMAHIEFEEKSVPREEELVKAKIRRLKGSGKI